jgi:signal peptidase II
MVNKHLFVSIIAIIVLVADQLTKFFIRSYFSVGETKAWLFTYIQNKGSLFGAMQGSVFPLIIISIIALAVLAYYYPKLKKNNFVQVMYALLIAGIIGNLIDRIFLGYVVDFINLHVWPVFNIADVCITVSIIGLLIYFWKR